jgi:hypothetical protein
MVVLWAFALLILTNITISKAINAALSMRTNTPTLNESQDFGVDSICPAVTDRNTDSPIF